MLIHLLAHRSHHREDISVHAQAGLPLAVPQTAYPWSERQGCSVLRGDQCVSSFHCTLSSRPHSSSTGAQSLAKSKAGQEAPREKGPVPPFYSPHFSPHHSAPQNRIAQNIRSDPNWSPHAYLPMQHVPGLINHPLVSPTTKVWASDQI